MEITMTPIDPSKLSEEIRSLPKIEIPVSGVTGYSLANEEKQCVFFMVEEGVSAPEHAHCAQVGTVVEGEMTLEIDGKVDLYVAGDVYHIPEGCNHRTSFSKPTMLIDLFDKPDRYPVRG